MENGAQHYLKHLIWTKPEKQTMHNQINTAKTDLLRDQISNKTMTL
jgi:hypothetical protein